MATEGKKSGGGKVVLVGTYRGDQLTAWRGWYDYPISDSDFSRVEHVERVDGRARSPSAPQSPADHSCATELFVYDIGVWMVRRKSSREVLGAGEKPDIHSFKEAV